MREAPQGRSASEPVRTLANSPRYPVKLLFRSRSGFALSPRHSCKPPFKNKIPPSPPVAGPLRLCIPARYPSIP